MGIYKFFADLGEWILGEGDRGCFMCDFMRPLYALIGFLIMLISAVLFFVSCLGLFFGQGLVLLMSALFGLVFFFFGKLMFKIRLNRPHLYSGMFNFFKG